MAEDSRARFLNEQTAHRYCFYITVGRAYADVAKAIRMISVMREHAVPNVRLMIEEWAWALRKISYLIKYAVIVVSSAPIMCMYPFVQKYFNQGVMKETHNDIECLYICVSDNGKGFSPEILEKIENDGEIYYNNRRHVGLQNIKKRLKLIYGEQAAFHLSNMDEGFGAISEVWIPLKDK